MIIKHFKFFYNQKVKNTYTYTLHKTSIIISYSTLFYLVLSYTLETKWIMKITNKYRLNGINISQKNIYKNV